MKTTILVGDARKRLGEIENKSIHSCLTSPPYWGARDCGVDGQLGQEPQIRDYIENLCLVFDEVYRVLRDDGSLWVNLADTFSGSGRGLMGDGTSFCSTERGAATKQATNKGSASGKFGKRDDSFLPSKSIVGVPWRFAFAMQDRGWILREDIVWQKPNPMPESTKDRCTRGHEYLFHFVKKGRYFFSREHLVEPCVSVGHEQTQHKTAEATEKTGTNKSGLAKVKPKTERNMRSVWSFAPESSRGSDHYARMPLGLALRCVQISTPVGGTVLDPFGGSGTTAIAAMNAGCHAVIVEINESYAQEAHIRCGLFCEIQ